MLFANECSPVIDALLSSFDASCAPCRPGMDDWLYPSNADVLVPPGLICAVFEESEGAWSGDEIPPLLPKSPDLGGDAGEAPAGELDVFEAS